MDSDTINMLILRLGTLGFPGWERLSITGRFIGERCAFRFKLTKADHRTATVMIFVNDATLTMPVDDLARFVHKGIAGELAVLDWHD